MHSSMKSETEFRTWLHGHLDTIQLGDDEFVEYILNILKETTIEHEEKVVSIVTFLDAAAPDVPESFTGEIVDRWAELDKVLLEKRKQEEEARRASSTTHKALSEAASSIEALSLDNEPQSSSRTLDVAARRRLLQQYGYESDEDEDGDGQEKEDQPLAAANRNAVKAVADAKKNEARKAHMERVAQDKAALEKDRQSKQEKKEARQKAAQKGERRR